MSPNHLLLQQNLANPAGLYLSVQGLSFKLRTSHPIPSSFDWITTRLWYDAVTDRLTPLNLILALVLLLLQRRRRRRTNSSATESSEAEADDDDDEKETTTTLL
uniref:Uncharacterized protein n=1 Tax=Chloropicon laureae TaxID=464258 RepID=A0A7S3E3Y6_9CHLO